MRCFIGVPLPSEVSQRLIKAQDCFKKVDARMSLVKEDNLHVSLYFLGDVDNVDKIKDSLKDVEFKPFLASVKNISFFPKKGYIKVIHSPINKGVDSFSLLHKKVCESLNLSFDGHFNPHVTLARVKFVTSTNVLRRACFNERFEQDFEVSSFNLYQSKLSPKGPEYKVLGSY